MLSTNFISFVLFFWLEVAGIFADNLPPGSLNITVPPVPAHLLGHSIILVDAPATRSAASNSRGSGLAPGVPYDYVPSSDNKLEARQTGPFRPNDSQYPYRCIGKAFMGHIESGNRYVVDYVMTGTIVGDRVLLLEANFLTSPWGSRPWFVQFVPVYENGAAPFGDTYIDYCWGYRPGGGVNAIDYVVCRMYEPLGTDLGYLGYWYYNNPNDYFSTSYWVGGFQSTYMNGNYLGVWRDVNVISYDTPSQGGILLETLPFSPTSGLVGAPLWDNVNLEVVGILSGNNADAGETTRSNFAGGGSMADVIDYGRDNF